MAVVSTAWEWLSGHSIVSLLENRTWTRGSQFWPTFRQCHRLERLSS